VIKMMVGIRICGMKVIVISEKNTNNFNIDDNNENHIKKIRTMI
jgi:hypothetical protein